MDLSDPLQKQAVQVYLSGPGYSDELAQSYIERFDSIALELDDAGSADIIHKFFSRKENVEENMGVAEEYFLVGGTLGSAANAASAERFLPTLCNTRLLFEMHSIWRSKKSLDGKPRMNTIPRFHKFTPPMPSLSKWKSG